MSEPWDSPLTRRILDRDKAQQVENERLRRNNRMLKLSRAPASKKDQAPLIRKPKAPFRLCDEMGLGAPEDRSRYKDIVVSNLGFTTVSTLTCSGPHTVNCSNVHRLRHPRLHCTVERARHRSPWQAFPRCASSSPFSPSHLHLPPSYPCVHDLIPFFCHRRPRRNPTSSASPRIGPPLLLSSNTSPTNGTT